MSVGWTIFVAAIIALEKLLPWRSPASSTVALVLLVLSRSESPSRPSASPG
jgi:hypothetical protein